MIEELKKYGEVKENVNLKRYTTYKLNETASYLLKPNNLEELIELLKYIDKNNINYKIIGNGSNLIFTKKYEGILIKLDNFNKLEINENKIIVGAGYSLLKLANNLSKLGYTGLEFATGIPATIGGAVFMNAGAYKSDMSNIIESIKVITPDYKIKELNNKDLNFSYRTSLLQKNKYICIEATLKLEKGEPDKILELIENRKQRRINTQPLEYPSAGSVFRNPEGDFAARLIEELGFKGTSINGATVSKKHANFIINEGNASGKDIKALIYEIKDKVKEKYDIDLIIEQEFVE